MLQGEQGDDGKVEGPSGPPGDRVNIIVNAFNSCHTEGYTICKMALEQCISLSSAQRGGFTIIRYNHPTLLNLFSTYKSSTISSCNDILSHC